MTTLTDILAALVASIQGYAGPYSFTATDAVKVGTFVDEVPMLPFCALEEPEVRTTPWDGRQRKWLHEVTIAIRAWVPFSTETLGGRQAASIVAADQLAAALLLGRRTQQALRLVNTFAIGAVELDPIPFTASPDIVRTSVSLTLSYVTLGGV